MLIAIEGIDGSGKGTQAARLVESLRETGKSVGLLSFPRYDETFFGRAVGQFLNGRFGSLGEANPFLVSLLFAGDRFESREVLRQELDRSDVVVLDRYVASNVAHQGAKLPKSERSDLIDFVEQLEYAVYDLPRPELTLLLDLPAETAQELVARKNARSYTDASHDLQEADGEYLANVRQMYLTLAEASAGWRIVSCLAGDRLRSIDEIAEELSTLVNDHLVGS